MEEAMGYFGCETQRAQVLTLRAVPFGVTQAPAPVLFLSDQPERAANLLQKHITATRLSPVFPA